MWPLSKAFTVGKLEHTSKTDEKEMLDMFLHDCIFYMSSANKGKSSILEYQWDDYCILLSRSLYIQIEATKAP